MAFWIVLRCFSSGMAECDGRLGNRKAPGGNWGIGTAVCPLAETGATCGRADRRVRICLRCFRWGLVGGLVGGLVWGLVWGLVFFFVLSARFRSRLSGSVRWVDLVAVMPWKPPVETGGW